MKPHKGVLQKSTNNLKSEVLLISHRADASLVFETKWIRFGMNSYKSWVVVRDYYISIYVKANSVSWEMLDDNSGTVLSFPTV